MIVGVIKIAKHFVAILASPSLFLEYTIQFIKNIFKSLQLFNQ